MRVVIENNKDVFDEVLLKYFWNVVFSLIWDCKLVWVYGDVVLGNLFVKDGKFCVVIDFGILGVGDFVCDVVMVWMFFDENSRNVFKEVLCMDEEMWNRVRGWVFWKVLIIYDVNRESNEKVVEELYCFI